MRKRISMLAVMALALTTLISCDLLEKEDDEDDDKLNFELLYDCLWRPDHSSESDDIPEDVSDPGHYIHFTRNGKMLILSYDNDLYSYLHTFSYILDKKKEKIKFTLGGKDYKADINSLCINHLTVLFDDEDNEYVYLKRMPLPDEQEVAKSSFPKGAL